MNSREAGFWQGSDTRRSLPPESAESYYMEGFIGARILGREGVRAVAGGSLPASLQPT